MQSGAGGAGLGQIAKAAGVSRQAIYLHFRDRADLYVAMVRHFDGQRGLAEALARIEQAPGGKAALAEAVAMQARMNPDLQPVAAALEALRHQDAALQRAWDDRLASRLDAARVIANRLAADGALRADVDPSLAADLIWTLLSLRTWQDLVVLRGWSAELYCRHIENLLARMLYACPDDHARCGN